MTLCEPPAIDSPESFAGVWSVAMVEGGREKRAAAALDLYGVPYFLPLVTLTTPRGSRTYTRDVPLFSNYLFTCCGTDADAYNVRRCDRYVQIISVADQRKFVREISDVHRAIGAGEVRAFHLPVIGQRCRVTGGPFEGFEGVLVHTPNLLRFVLEVQTLGRAVELSVPPELLEPID